MSVGTPKRCRLRLDPDPHDPEKPVGGGRRRKSHRALPRVSSLAPLWQACGVNSVASRSCLDRKKEWIMHPENEAPGGHEGECTYSVIQTGSFGCARNAPR